MKIAAALALLIATSAISVEAYGLNRGPHSYAQGVTPGSGLTVGSREFDRRYKAYRIMKATGYSLLGSGFGIVIAGIGLVEASAFGPVGMAGFIAIAPDLLSGKGPGGGGTDSVDRQGAVRLVRELDRSPDGEVVRRLNAAVKYATSLPAARSEFGSVGFCWGGSTSFAYAPAQPKLGAAVVYYGSAPASEALANIEAPVLGLYGGDDARVNATIAPADEEMQRLGKRYEYEIYDGAGHGFLRQQSGRDGANMWATEQAWPRTVAFFKAELGS